MILPGGGGEGFAPGGAEEEEEEEEEEDCCASPSPVPVVAKGARGDEVDEVSGYAIEGMR